MAQTQIPIAQQNYTPQGSPYTFGPQALPTGYTLANITIDRTIGGHSLNADPQTTKVTLRLEISYDGGITWGLLAQGDAEGGLYHNDDGTTITTSYLGVSLYQPTNPNRQARGILTVIGGTVSFSGTITLSDG